ncbi:hypothetical protein [Microbacterium sp. CCH5-D1]|uniref:hypothetical protein n=1 Tax=Microbacterium sp. CCH5-D1 TaxID=1768780 RepID=UPI00076A4C41|nr:hypothetical protein [Microbacterium sp. CCH5-D1]
MTDVIEDELDDQPSLPQRASENGEDTFERLVKHAAECGLKASIQRYETEDSVSRRWVEIEFGNGRNSRAISVDASGAEVLMNVTLDSIVFLGDYLAYVDRTTGTIEARVNQVGAGGMAGQPRLHHIPGATVIYAESEDDGERYVSDSNLELEKAGRHVGIVNPSPVARALFNRLMRRSKVLRIEGFDASRHDDALALLEKLSGSLFFDLDVMYGIPLTLQRVRSALRRRPLSRSKKTMQFPTNVYAPEALALYQYGRSAQQLPLLEFLAYYQALEFYFPAFAHAGTSSAIRSELLNPRFDPTSDSDISRLIDLAGPAVRAGIGEREQLRATVLAATTVEGVRGAIDRLSTSEGNPITDKPSRIRGADPVRVQANDVREQLADRIYAIRCRIVHTKQDGGGTGAELLLPTGAEVSHLYADISLVRYVAQQAIFGQARRE